MNWRRQGRQKRHDEQDYDGSSDLGRRAVRLGTIPFVIDLVTPTCMYMYSTTVNTTTESFFLHGTLCDMSSRKRRWRRRRGETWKETSAPRNDPELSLAFCRQRAPEGPRDPICPKNPRDDSGVGCGVLSSAGSGALVTLSEGQSGGGNI
ncbi:Hypothetical protein SMAX5B_018797 [Scophthalmus maximus]|uniref:Uncharacterized protein n=1 Tax=Scophthalmus maximus TaxID=52904 RepID=A0A2U9BSE2_SCOMX|nr:Hypothetical protein SMAX5B_018797 [Scophthalmus maximus]